MLAYNPGKMSLHRPKKANMKTDFNLGSTKVDTSKTNLQEICTKKCIKVLERTLQNVVHKQKETLKIGIAPI